MDENGKWKTTVDPCPTCGSDVINFDRAYEHVRSNPEAVVSIRNPDCPHESDPDADCICQSFINPSPNPALDNYVKVDSITTFGPCGHSFHEYELRDWKITRTLTPGWHQKRLEELAADAARHNAHLDLSRVGVESGNE